MVSSTIKQVIKFVFVGGLNTLVDLGILNLLIFSTGKGIHGGIIFMIFKSISFTTAVLNSYLLNKKWVFKASLQEKRAFQFSGFFLVSIIGAFINILVATFVVTHIAHSFISAGLCPTLAGLCGSASGMSWNFIGYKYLVFGTSGKTSA